MREIAKSPILCIGEVLWDVLGEERKPGGAPMNVALHLANLGHPVEILSRTGKDHPGTQLRAFLSERGLGTAYIQEDPELPTGEVLVELDRQGNASYEILAPVAWDRLAYTAEAEKLADGASLIVYGTLGSRDPVSRRTVIKCLESPALRFMDVNLRPPCTPRPLVQELLEPAHMAKLNDEELRIIAGWDGKESTDEESMMQWVAGRYGLERVVVTRGSRGALVLEEGWVTAHPGYRVNVADTVGAGDAFLAGFISALTAGAPAGEALDFACATGALVASRAGATPAYGMEEIRDIQHRKGK